MKIGLIDVDSHNFPNLALMKISAYHKGLGDEVSFVESNFVHYDKVYISKVFGDEYSKFDATYINADEIIYGGTGFAITIEDGKEVYHKQKDKELPYEVEHHYPDYSLYPDLTKEKAYGFLTRGCCNNCDYCIVSQKEGLCSVKVADLNEWWDGQSEIILLDPNLLACRERKSLIQQLINSGAKVNFCQGLDARFITEEVAEMLKKVNTTMWHFAFDLMKNEKQIIQGLNVFTRIVKPNKRNCCVYCLTNFNTSFSEDYYRINKIREIGLTPDVRVYRKEALPKRHILRDFQRWCNNRFVFRSVPDFWDYAPRKDGLSMKATYPEHYSEWLKYKG